MYICIYIFNMMSVFHDLLSSPACRTKKRAFGAVGTWESSGTTLKLKKFACCLGAKLLDLTFEYHGAVSWWWTWCFSVLSMNLELFFPFSFSFSLGVLYHVFVSMIQPHTYCTKAFGMSCLLLIHVVWFLHAIWPLCLKVWAIQTFLTIARASGPGHVACEACSCAIPRGKGHLHLKCQRRTIRLVDPCSPCLQSWTSRQKNRMRLMKAKLTCPESGTWKAMVSRQTGVLKMFFGFDVAKSCEI